MTGIPSGYFKRFEKLLKNRGISVTAEEDSFLFRHEKKVISLRLPQDYIVTSPEKLVALVQSRLGLNTRVFARNCFVRRIDKSIAEDFLNQYHLMNATQSALALGLFLKDDLLAVASFSKGRKMNRLPGDKRSFELIRFCSKDGVTITGGLTRLVKHFCREKNAGDVMTYVDKQMSRGESFLRAGFVKLGETGPHVFKVNKKTFLRSPLQPGEKEHQSEDYFYLKSPGNVKLVFSCLNE